jgi:predicted RecB family nuclease
MATRITRDIVISYINCKYKAHLKLANQHGTRSNYELLLEELWNELKLKAIRQLVQHHKDTEQALHLNLDTLRHRSSFLIDVTLNDDQFSLIIDGLKLVEGHSRLGDYHYIPVLFSESWRIRVAQRQLLNLYGLIIARLQDRMPESGIIWHGKECWSTKVRLSPNLRKVKAILEGVLRMRELEQPPKLVLNEHCQQCESRQRCRDQAMNEGLIQEIELRSSPQLLCDLLSKGQPFARRANPAARRPHEERWSSIFKSHWKRIEDSRKIVMQVLIVYI